MDEPRVIIIPALSDNYMYLLVSGSRAAVIDPAEAAPVLEALSRHDLTLEWILNTHHHFDHVAGNEELKRGTGATIISPENARIPGVDRTVGEGDTLDFHGIEIRVLATPGHGRDDVSYFIPSSETVSESMLFCGDTLFVCGCGRLLEGTPDDMWASLRKLTELPDETRIYCGHEYTEENVRFALGEEPGNESLRNLLEEVRTRLRRGEPTVPSNIGMEKRTNPFLRAADVRQFIRLRRKKDVF